MVRSPSGGLKKRKRKIDKVLRNPYDHRVSIRTRMRARVAKEAALSLRRYFFLPARAISSEEEKEEEDGPTPLTFPAMASSLAELETKRRRRLARAAIIALLWPGRSGRRDAAAVFPGPAGDDDRFSVRSHDTSVRASVRQSVSHSVSQWLR